MSMGSDFSSGYGLGLDTKRVNQAPSFNPWTYLAQAGGGVTPSFRGGGTRSGGVGGGVPAKQILENARIEALKQKEADLKLKEGELKLTAQDIANKAAEQKINHDKLDYYAKRTKEAEDKAQGLRTENWNQQYGKDVSQFDVDRDAAARGFATRDKNAIMKFFNNYGNADSNINDITWGDGSLDDAGTVYMQYNDGNTVAYPNAQDAIEKTLLPMSAIEQNKRTGMTDYQRAQLESKEQERLDKRSKEWGEQNTKAKQAEANSNNKIYEKYVNDAEKYNMENDDQIPIMSRDEYFRTRGLNTKAPNRAGNQRTPSEAGFTQGMDTSGNGNNQRTVVRTGKDKSGKKVVQYSDGSIEYSE